MDVDKLSTLNQVQVALHQLERAIKLFLHERDFISAITLAGASDSILGETAKDRGKVPVLSRSNKRLLRSR